MSSKIILFRADSSSSIGTGHIMRDLVLAQKYAKKGYKIIFAMQDLDGNINYKIKEAGYKIKILKSNSKKELKKLIKKLKIDMVVFDNYNIDEKYEKYIKNKTKVRILSFDDTYQKHYCDILLNHNISADEKRYKGLVPKYCELRCGTKYTLLREEFIIQKKSKTLFIAMGGADHSNINIDILEVLKEFKYIEVKLVTTTVNQNLEQLKEYVQDKDWIELHINSNKIAKLMRISDFTIVTPSVTLNEVFFMELPFIAIKTADNQEDMVEYLLKHEYLLLKEFDSNKLKNIITKLIGESK